ncbi:MAG: OmpA family protein [Bacteroidia bacterium]|nr:OmpA family protein [Bacteroidia bacterium]
MKRFLLIFLLVGLELSAQKAKPDTVFCDCDKARILSINDNATVNKTLSSSGFGNIKEISPSKQKTHFAFEQEHYSAWYKLNIKSEGHLCFDIVPNKPQDDYDFMLFKAGSNFCDSLSKYKIKPVRACISRNKEEIKGYTGLNNLSKKEFVKEGIGDSYVKSILVKPGETYYLVLDNVYEGGEGHSIRFYMEEPVQIKGKVINENNNPVKADITLTNQKGDTLFTSQSDKNGNYLINASLRKSTNYVLNFYADSSLIFAKNINVKSQDSILKIETVLPKLKKGLKYPIGSINFHGGLAVYITAAIPSLYNLRKLMRANPTLKIKIIGHTNGCDAGVDELSVNRAKRIKQFLVENKVEESRIEVEGKGCREMLFPKPLTFSQMEQNRRVEVMVIEY